MLEQLPLVFRKCEGRSQLPSRGPVPLPGPSWRLYVGGGRTHRRTRQRYWEPRGRGARWCVGGRGAFGLGRAGSGAAESCPASRTSLFIYPLPFFLFFFYPLPLKGLTGSDRWLLQGSRGPGGGVAAEGNLRGPQPLRGQHLPTPRRAVTWAGGAKQGEQGGHESVGAVRATPPPGARWKRRYPGSKSINDIFRTGKAEHKANVGPSGCGTVRPAVEPTLPHLPPLCGLGQVPTLALQGHREE